jgi:adenylosuccinate lyase
MTTDPLTTRYASREMRAIFSDKFKYESWRHLWVALAKAEKSLGLPITREQIEQMEERLSPIDFARVAVLEKISRHDVMAHIAAFGECAPLAAPIIHLGATSAFVTDNTDLLQIRAGLQLLKGKFVRLIETMQKLATQYADLPCLSYTHLQPAQPTTVGKRLCLWLQDFLTDVKDLLAFEEAFVFLGLKGATGTQASYLALFDGDEEKVHELEKRVSKEMGFDRVWTITCQTYPRKQDQRLLNLLASFGSSAHKCATDLRLLSHMQQLDEPFEEQQAGSSAMPHKRNPMRSERICALSRYLISLAENPAYTAATQWLERSLDDSANRRIVLSGSFLTADAILNLLQNVFSGLVFYPKVIAAALDKELPFLCLETLLMQGVKKGGDRQKLRAALSKHSLASSRKMKEEGGDPDLFERICADPSLNISQADIQASINLRKLVGSAPSQVRQFLREEVEPLLSKIGEVKVPVSPVEI